MRTRAAVLLLPMLVALAGCDLPVHHSWQWKAADLDRNRYNLGLYRGARSGEQLATWTRNGEVVAASGRAPRGAHGDLAITVRYAHDDGGGGLFTDSGPDEQCYRFTTPDGYDVELDRVACPDR